MTDEQYLIAQGLGQATFLPGSWDKRFARAVARLPIEHALSDKQANWLAHLAWKYRRQMPMQVAKMATPTVSLQDTEKLQRWNAGKAR